MGSERASGDAVHILSLAGASCDGCTMAALGASHPGLEDLLLAQVPDLPPIRLVHPVLAFESGEEFLAPFERAAAGDLSPFILVLEGSVLDESLAGEGSFSRLGFADGAPLSTAGWVDRLAPRADAVIAIGSCATWGGVPAAAGSPTGARGLSEHLGAGFRSRSGLPVVNMPGCAPPGEAFVESVVAVLFHLAGLVPLELDEESRPRWLYASTVRPQPPRAGYLPASAYAAEGRPEVGCAVPTQGWMRGIGGCARVGGACVGCTDRGFPDRFLALARLHRVEGDAA